MAKVYKCDICGTVTDQIAAEVVIRVKAHVAKEMPRNWNYGFDEGHLDCCLKCYTEKFAMSAEVPLMLSSDKIVEL